MTRCCFEGFAYHPIAPCADNDQLAAKGRRMMLCHEREAEPRFFVAPAGELHAGWVIGVEHACGQAAA